MSHSQAPANFTRLRRTRILTLGNLNTKGHMPDGRYHSVPCASGRESFPNCLAWQVSATVVPQLYDRRSNSSKQTVLLPYNFVSLLPIFCCLLSCSIETLSVFEISSSFLILVHERLQLDFIQNLAIEIRVIFLMTC